MGGTRWQGARHVRRGRGHINVWISVESSEAERFLQDALVLKTPMKLMGDCFISAYYQCLLRVQDSNICVATGPTRRGPV